MGKVHVCTCHRSESDQRLLTIIFFQGSLARAGKVKSQTPKVPYPYVYISSPSPSQAHTSYMNASPISSCSRGLVVTFFRSISTPGHRMIADESGDGRSSPKRRKRRTYLHIGLFLLFQNFNVITDQKGAPRRESHTPGDL